MPSFLSKVFGRKKDDNPRTDDSDLLDGKFEAVSPSATKFPEVANGRQARQKEKDSGFNVFRSKSRPSSPEPTEKRVPVPQLSLNLPGPKDESASRALGVVFEADPDAQILLSDAAIGRRRLSPLETLILVRVCSEAITARGLETLGIMHPHWYSASPEVQRKLISLFLQSLAPKTPITTLSPTPSAFTSAFESEISSTRSPHDVAAVLRWGLRHLQLEGTSLGKDETWYKTFFDAERSAGYPPNGYSSTLAPVLPVSHLELLSATLEIFSSLAAHAEANGISGSKLSKFFGLWLLTVQRSQDDDDWAAFYARWERNARMLEHLFLSRIRDDATESRMPVRLLELVKRYPYQTDPTADLLARPRFSTLQYDALFVRIETELSSTADEPSHHPLRLISEAFRAEVNDDASEHTAVWEAIKTAGATDGISSPTYPGLSHIFTDDTLRFFSLVPVEKGSIETRSPSFNLYTRPTSRRSSSLSDKDIATAAVATATSSVLLQPSKTPTSPVTPSSGVNSPIGLDWVTFSTSGFFEEGKQHAPLAATLLEKDKDIEVTIPRPSSPKRRSFAAARKSLDIPRTVAHTEEAKASPSASSAAASKPAPPVVKHTSKSTRVSVVQLDEAFIDFWNDALLDPISSSWPAFIICRLQTTLPGTEISGKPVEWLVLEQVFKRPPPPLPLTPPPTASTSSHGSARRASSPTSLKSEGSHTFSSAFKIFNFFSSPTRPSMSLGSRSKKSPGATTSPRVGEMGEILAEDESGSKKDKAKEKAKTAKKEDTSTVRVRIPSPKPRKSVDVPRKSVDFAPTAKKSLDSGSRPTNGVVGASLSAGAAALVGTASAVIVEATAQPDVVKVDEPASTPAPEPATNGLLSPINNAVVAAAVPAIAKEEVPTPTPDVSADTPYTTEEMPAVDATAESAVETGDAPITVVPAEPKLVTEADLLQSDANPFAPPTADAICFFRLPTSSQGDELDGGASETTRTVEETKLAETEVVSHHVAVEVTSDAPIKSTAEVLPVAVDDLNGHVLAATVSAVVPKYEVVEVATKELEATPVVKVEEESASVEEPASYVEEAVPEPEPTPVVEVSEETAPRETAEEPTTSVVNVLPEPEPTPVVEVQAEIAPHETVEETATSVEEVLPELEPTPIVEVQEEAAHEPIEEPATSVVQVLPEPEPVPVVEVQEEAAHEPIEETATSVVEVLPELEPTPVVEVQAEIAPHETIEETATSVEEVLPEPVVEVQEEVAHEPIEEPATTVDEALPEPELTPVVEVQEDVASHELIEEPATTVEEEALPEPEPTPVVEVQEDVASHELIEKPATTVEEALPEPEPTPVVEVQEDVASHELIEEPATSVEEALPEPEPTPVVEVRIEIAPHEPIEEPATSIETSVNETNVPEVTRETITESIAEVTAVPDAQPVAESPSTIVAPEPEIQVEERKSVEKDSVAGDVTPAEAESEVPLVAAAAVPVVLAAGAITSKAHDDAPVIAESVEESIEAEPAVLEAEEQDSITESDAQAMQEPGLREPAPEVVVSAIVPVKEPQEGIVIEQANNELLEGTQEPVGIKEMSEEPVVENPVLELEATQTAESVTVILEDLVNKSMPDAVDVTQASEPISPEAGPLNEANESAVTSGNTEALPETKPLVEAIGTNEIAVEDSVTAEAAEPGPASINESFHADEEVARGSEPGFVEETVEETVAYIKEEPAIETLPEEETAPVILVTEKDIPEEVTAAAEEEPLAESPGVDDEVDSVDDTPVTAVELDAQHSALAEQDTEPLVEEVVQETALEVEASSHIDIYTGSTEHVEDEITSPEGVPASPVEEAVEPVAEIAADPEPVPAVEETTLLAESPVEVEDTDSVAATTSQPVIESEVLPIEEAASDVLAEEQGLQVQEEVNETEDQPIDETAAATEVDVLAHADGPEPALPDEASEPAVEDKSIAEIAAAIDNETVSARDDVPVAAAPAAEIDEATEQSFVEDVAATESEDAFIQEERSGSNADPLIEDSVEQVEEQAEEPIVQGASEPILDVTESAVEDASQAVVEETSGAIIEQAPEPAIEQPVELSVEQDSLADAPTVAETPASAVENESVVEEAIAIDHSTGEETSEPTAEHADESLIKQVIEPTVEVSEPVVDSIAEPVTESTEPLAEAAEPAVEVVPVVEPEAADVPVEGAPRAILENPSELVVEDVSQPEVDNEEATQPMVVFSAQPEEIDEATVERASELTETEPAVEDAAQLEESIVEEVSEPVPKASKSIDEEVSPVVEEANEHAVEEVSTPPIEEAVEPIVEEPGEPVVQESKIDEAGEEAASASPAKEASTPVEEVPSLSAETTPNHLQEPVAEDPTAIEEKSGPVVEVDEIVAQEPAELIAEEEPSQTAVVEEVTVEQHVPLAEEVPISTVEDTKESSELTDIPAPVEDDSQNVELVENSVEGTSPVATEEPTALHAIKEESPALVEADEAAIEESVEVSAPPEEHTPEVASAAQVEEVAVEESAPVVEEAEEAPIPAVGDEQEASATASVTEMPVEEASQHVEGEVAEPGVEVEAKAEVAPVVAEEPISETIPEDEPSPLTEADDVVVEEPPAVATSISGNEDQICQPTAAATPEESAVETSIEHETTEPVVEEKPSPVVEEHATKEAEVAEESSLVVEAGDVVEESAPPVKNVEDTLVPTQVIADAPALVPETTNIPVEEDTHPVEQPTEPLVEEEEIPPILEEPTVKQAVENVPTPVVEAGKAVVEEGPTDNVMEEKVTPTTVETAPVEESIPPAFVVEDTEETPIPVTEDVVEDAPSHTEEAVAIELPAEPTPSPSAAEPEPELEHKPEIEAPATSEVKPTLTEETEPVPASEEVESTLVSEEVVPETSVAAEQDPVVEETTAETSVVENEVPAGVEIQPAIEDARESEALPSAEEASEQSPLEDDSTTVAENGNGHSHAIDELKEDLVAASKDDPVVIEENGNGNGHSIEDDVKDDSEPMNKAVSEDTYDTNSTAPVAEE